MVLWCSPRAGAKVLDGSAGLPLSVVSELQQQMSHKLQEH